MNWIGPDSDFDLYPGRYKSFQLSSFICHGGENQLFGSVMYF